jgi:hypothetical protein
MRARWVLYIRTNVRGQGTESSSTADTWSCGYKCSTVRSLPTVVDEYPTSLVSSLTHGVPVEASLPARCVVPTMVLGQASITSWGLRIQGVGIRVTMQYCFGYLRLE